MEENSTLIRHQLSLMETQFLGLICKKEIVQYSNLTSIMKEVQENDKLLPFQYLHCEHIFS
uniref:Uncharacterized protein n=1 Tax=Arundo donax TaxID=35708 RepID=A0A0A9FUX2_ARUDO